MVIMVELLFLLSFLVELQSYCFHMYLENKIVKNGVNFISLLFKKPVSWLCFTSPPLLHILGLSLSQILLTSASLFFCSLFLPLTKQQPNPQKEVQDQDLGQQDSLGDIIEISRTGDEIFTNKDEDDGTIPDEESFIELSLPSGHYVGQHFSTMAGHQDFGLIQLLAEFEDDNLIEIDISVGSIKCYTFQIKA
ncbi:BnaC09g51810D [Brassica napus]|uniref:Uncharacterized protein n=6 Tax=Brassica TaxID=3705 RepID=A0A0D3E6B2_BRAOL|nr:PREDICTED: uncharacterized protein LOC106315397 [Brassica oleracea var. oleracea]XP_048623508.1 uncharacterized protein LOC106364342 [Brassica napus]CAF1730796.1 unnamed protein product [Brassica napus]CDY64312.1 BnaC09g51810D [Brassica napus]VDD30187.1 unnamed protein product [Brassica oleracea]